MSAGEQARRTEVDPTPPPPGETVLIIEPNVAERRRLAKLVESPCSPGVGFRAVTAASLGEAVRILASEPSTAPMPQAEQPDPVRVILLSVEQERSVLAALPILRTGTNAPIVLLASAAHEMLALRACRHGAAEYLLREQADRTLLLRTLRYAIERRETDIALQEHDRAYRTLIANVPGVAYRASARANWALEFASAGFEQITGYPVHAIVARGGREAPAAFHDLIVDDDRERVEEVERAAVEAQEPFHLQYRIRRRDGAIRWLDVRGQGVRDQRGVLVAHEGFFADITEQKETQHALQEKAAQLRQAQKLEAVGQLAGGIAHDFNNVLAAIVAHAEVALSEMSDVGFTREHVAVQELADLLVAAHRAGHLTQQLLLFSRKQVPQPTLLNLNGIVEAVQRLLRRTLGVDVDVATELDAAHPWVFCDQSQIEQIVMNLAVNARDAMPTGGGLVIRTETVDVHTDTRLVEPDEGLIAGGPVAPGPYVALTVADSGHGMSLETMARIFEPYYTTKEHGKGTGLGLATVYGVVTDAEGAIRVISRPGTGTAFTVFLPLHAAPASVEASVASEARPRGTETILLVDDEAGLRKAVGRLLERQGYTVHLAADVGEALRILATHRHAVDLVLSDMMLPGLSGDVLVRALLARSPRPRIVLMSGNARSIGSGGMGESLADDDATMLADAFLQKPVQMDTLFRVVRATLDSAMRPAHSGATYDSI